MLSDCAFWFRSEAPCDAYCDEEMREVVSEERPGVRRERSMVVVMGQLVCDVSFDIDDGKS